MIRQAEPGQDGGVDATLVLKKQNKSTKKPICAF
jgi:hypothetical protein